MSFENNETIYIQDDILGIIKMLTPPKLKFAQVVCHKTSLKI